MKTIINKRRTFTILLAAAVAGLLLVTLPPAVLATPPGPPGSDPNFEVDANAFDNDLFDNVDDWETFYPFPPGLPHGNLIATTGIITDGLQKSIFTTGGSKDIRDIPSWKWKDGSVPDKDDLLNAYFAAYGSGTELITYIGADRYSNDGDSMMGAWFFQDVVEAKPDGTFSGEHKNGDILWLGHFSGGGVITSLQILKWNEQGKANWEEDHPDQVKGTNLVLLWIAEEEPGVEGLFWAAVNRDDTESPWPYTPKQGPEGYFPYNSFMEGGINMSQMLGGDLPCFNSVLIETRSSTSLTAQLKDFVLDSLNTCKISVTKTCPISAIASDMESIEYTYQVTVRNEGFGTINSVDLRDDMGTAPTDPDDPEDPAYLDDRIWTHGGNILSGVTETVGSYTINSTDNPPAPNWVYATGNAGAYSTAEVKDYAECRPVRLNPEFSLIQGCTDVKIVEITGLDKVVVEVDFAGQVCNSDTNTKLKDVVVEHEAAGEVLSMTTPLGPGDCENFSGSFYPGPLDIDGDGTPASQIYGKWVEATGKEFITGEPVSTGEVGPDPTRSRCGLCE